VNLLRQRQRKTEKKKNEERGRRLETQGLTGIIMEEVRYGMLGSLIIAYYRWHCGS
jgi:hypothetical protein